MQSDPYFQLIPVIDLKDGEVVHARAGKRNEYLPIHLHSKIVTDSAIASVIKAFRQIYPFETFYIADLNAIRNSGHHHELILEMLAKYPDCEFWIDEGKQQGNSSFHGHNYKSVYGSEAQVSELQTMQANEILSLDFMQGQFLGHKSWLRNHAFWPERLILMNLDYVGGHLGPDLEKLDHYIANYPHQKIYAAGGVRNNTDLLKLKHIGVAGVLLASALHNNNLDFNML